MPLLFEFMRKIPRYCMIALKQLMSYMRSLPSMGKRLFHSKAVRYSFFGLILIAILLFLFRGCASNMLGEKTYIIGQDHRWQDLNFMGKERNLTAFNNELLREIAQKEGFHVRLMTTLASDFRKDLENEKLQGFITSQPPTQENEFVFSNPILLLGPVLIMRSGAPIAGWNEMGKKIIGIQTHSHIVPNLENDPTVQIKFYTDILQAMSDLNARLIDGVIYPAFAAHIYTKTFYPYDLKVVTQPLTNEGIRLVALKNDEGEELIKLFNEGLAAFKQDGTYTQLLEQWGLVDVEKIKP